jgi:hypothetical protein
MGARFLFRAPERRPASSPERPAAGHPLPQARRDSNPQPPVLETGALPVELRTFMSPETSAHPLREPSSYGQGRNRTADTTIFSRVLYQLSYLAKKTARTNLGAGGVTVERGSSRLYRRIPPARLAGLNQVSARSLTGTSFAREEASPSVRPSVRVTSIIRPSPGTPCEACLEPRVPMGKPTSPLPNMETPPEAALRYFE